jgi:ribose transport system ATP-binding protein
MSVSKTDPQRKAQHQPQEGVGAASPHVAFRRICKQYGQVQVLEEVSFEIVRGAVVALLGENGAGKSTLMKILSGYVPHSSGELLVDGKVQSFNSSRDAEACGVVLIHQEFNLAEDLSIAQNMFLGHEMRRGWWLDDVAMHREARKYLQMVGLDVASDRPVAELIVAQRQLVEIAKALSKNARLLIMDEPTATLTPGETQSLFRLIEGLRNSGVTIIYISHKLDEVEKLADEVVVMRDGRFVTRKSAAGLSRKDMANLMVGREMSDLFPRLTESLGGAALLSVRGLSVPGWVRNADFDVRPGEILGFAGLVGAGRTELFEGLLGLRPAQGGKVWIEERQVELRNPRQAARLGITYLSEDRKGKSLHVDLALRENLTLMSLNRYARPLLDYRAEAQALGRAIKEFGIRSRDHVQAASTLSGGNQQKLALAKYLQPDPKVIVLDEPTRGVDVGAKSEIYHTIAALARQGRGVVVISSELIELIGLCHRVVVMRSGTITATLDAIDLTEERLISHATGTH